MALQDILAGFRQLTGTQPAAPQQPANGGGNPGNMPNDTAARTAGLTDGVTAPNGVIPADANKTDAEKSPLDQFSKLWDTDPNVKPADPLFNLTPEGLQKAAASQDFRKSIKPEQLAAIAKGGNDAVAAFAEALNAVAQETYARSAVATTKLVEAALTKNNGTLESKFAETIRSQSVNDSLRTENPAFSHPAAQPLINAMQQQLLVKYPNATTAELRAMATDYLTAFSGVVAKPQSAADAAASKSTETDWSTFLG